MSLLHSENKSTDNFLGNPSHRKLNGDEWTAHFFDDDHKLREDVAQLGQILELFIKSTDSSISDAVEALTSFGRKWRTTVDGTHYLDQMAEEVKSYGPNKLIGVARAFTHFLALSNSAENHHRVRRIREDLLMSATKSPLPIESHESCCGSVIQLRDAMKISKEDILKAISLQSVEIVLTAHPTEVNRRSIIQKHERIHALLDQLDRSDLTIYEKHQFTNELEGQIACIWDTDELRREKPSPVKEASNGLKIVENVLWNAVPRYLRKLDVMLKQQLGEGLPLTAVPIKVASWMGGDRDGNPNVTPMITFEVSMLSRWVAATLFKNDIHILRSELSIRDASPELLQATSNSREPYRDILKRIEDKLEETIIWASSQMKNPDLATAKNSALKTKEFMDSLMLIHHSLIATNKGNIADGRITDIIRKLAAFGLTLLPMDIRQESNRHSEALDAITRYLGVGSYLHWDEDTRRTWLQSELSSRRPLLRSMADGGASLGFSETVVDTLQTFSVIAALDEGSLGAYVISQCQQASDILAVLLLQDEAGVKNPLRVVPLFETLDDLTQSAATIEALFAIPTYRGRIKNKQEIMVGYSDSAKDAGKLAASWAQYNAQEAMIRVGKKYDIEITFFHGKGGTVGRGGNPAIYEAILAHPPNTINGRFRATEQGEMITQNFGQDEIAERTLDLVTAGVLMEKFLKRPDPKPEWRDMMERLSEVSCKAYRQVVREEPRFVPYFRMATPELELAGLNVGSRPSKRNPKGGVESLRAIPWVFAWTQTRLNLPAWLGVGEAFNDELATNPQILKDMYKQWPWFVTLIDLFEMILAKSEEKIAENYDKQLVTDSELKELGKELRIKLRSTTMACLAVSGNDVLQCKNPTLLRSLQVRNPYVDPLNILQADLLRRLRQSENISQDDLKILKDALLISINGIANGMRNSG